MAQPSLALQSPPRDPGQLHTPSETRLPWCRVGVIGVPSLKGARGQRGLIPKARVCLRHIGGLGSALIYLLGPSCFLTFNPGASGGAVLPGLSGSSPFASLDFDVTPRGASPSAHRARWEQASQRRWRPQLRSAGEGPPPPVGGVGGGHCDCGDTAQLLSGQGAPEVRLRSAPGSARPHPWV